MTPFQFGFRKNISTQDALVYGTECIRNQIDSKKIVHAALLDLSKAFDSISHEVLIEKMLSLGFSNGANALIASFLNKRIQRVNINGIFQTGLKSNEVSHKERYLVRCCSIYMLMTYKSDYMKVVL